MAKRTSKNTNGTGPQPVFDYSNYSRRDQKALMHLQIKIQRLGQKIDDYDAWDTDEEFDAAVEEFEALQAESERALIKFIVSIPREWLIDGAPEYLDWNEPDSLDWLKSIKMKDLMDAAERARSPESVSGN